MPDFKLTKLAEKHDSFIIHISREAGAINFTRFDSIEEAVEREAEELGFTVEEMAKLTKAYSQEDLLEAAEEGYKWPLTLRLVEEIEEETVEEDTKAVRPLPLPRPTCRNEFIIHHTRESGDFNAADADCSVEEVGEQSTAKRLAYEPSYGSSINVYSAHSDARGLMKELTHGKTYPSGEPCWPTVRYQEKLWGYEDIRIHADYFYHLVAIIAYCEYAIEKRQSALLESVKQKALELIEEESVK